MVPVTLVACFGWRYLAFAHALHFYPPNSGLETRLAGWCPRFLSLHTAEPHILARNAGSFFVLLDPWIAEHSNRQTSDIMEWKKNRMADYYKQQHVDSCFPLA
ncbi:hypothetical protein V8F33_007075 [Rhypophila sp. PSN 637]